MIDRADEVVGRTVGWNESRYKTVMQPSPGGSTVPRKPSRDKAQPKIPVVSYAFENRTYQIDTERQKVYRQFVEIETSRAVAIYASWRAANLHA